MATPEKGTGNGTEVHISTDDGKTYKQFGSVTKVTGPSYSRETVDVTDNASFTANNQMKESAVGFIEADELKIEGFYKKTDEARTLVDTAFFAGAEVMIKVVMPKFIGNDVIFKGILTAYQEFGELSPDTGVAYSLSLKPNGKPTTTAHDGG